MLVYSPADERVIGPFIVVFIDISVFAALAHSMTVTRLAGRHERGAVGVHKPLALVHRKSGNTEFEFRVIGFAEGNSDGVTNREHVRRVVRFARVVVRRVVEILVRGLLYITPIRVVGLENMTESHQRHILHLDRIFLHASSVFYHHDRIMILARISNRILIMQVSA